MKKILLIIPYIPYPLDSGGNQAFFNMVDYIRDKMEVSVLLHLKKHNQQEKIEELKKIWPNVNFFVYESTLNNDTLSTVRNPLYYKWLQKVQASIKRKLKRQLMRVKNSCEIDIARNKSVLPHSIFEPLESNYINYVAKVSCMGFDIIQVEFYELISLGYVLPDNVQTIFVHHELRYIRNENELSLFKKITPEDHMLYHISRNFEKEALGKYKHIITLTETDQHLLNDLLQRNNNIYASPAVVNKNINFNTAFVPATTNRLTFIGSEDHYPNLDAVVWMCEEIIPRLRTSGMRPIFQVIGKWRSTYVKKLCAKYPEVELTGYIEDIRSFMKGSVTVVPIRIGSGMRMKILDAVNSKSPLITTTKGVEGLNFINEEECLIADTPDAFANAIIRLLNDTNLQKKLALQASAKLQEQYKPEKMLERRMAIYDSILA